MDTFEKIRALLAEQLDIDHRGLLSQKIKGWKRRKKWTAGRPTVHRQSALGSAGPGAGQGKRGLFGISPRRCCCANPPQE